MKVGFCDDVPFEITFGDSRTIPFGRKLRGYVPTSIEEDKSKTDENAKNESNNMSKDERIKALISHSEELENGIGYIAIQNELGEYIDSPTNILERESTFKKLLYTFYSICNQKKKLYTEEFFLTLMSYYGYQVPPVELRISKPDTNPKFLVEISKTFVRRHSISAISVEAEKIIDEINTFRIMRQYDCEARKFENQNDLYVPVYTGINYYMAVAYELVKQGYYVNKCEHCGRWFIANNKSDEKYCDRTSPKYSQKNCREAMIYIKQLEREQGNEAFKLYKQRYNVIYKKYGSSSNEMNDFKNQAGTWKEHIRNNTKTEQEYIDWLKTLRERKGVKRGKL